MNISSKETSTDDLKLSHMWVDIVESPRSEGKREGITILVPVAAKGGRTKKRGGHKYHWRVSLDPNKVYLDSAATYHSMFVTWFLENIRRVNTVLRGELQRRRYYEHTHRYARTFLYVSYT